LNLNRLIFTLDNIDNNIDFTDELYYLHGISKYKNIKFNKKDNIYYNDDEKLSLIMARSSLMFLSNCITDG
jgi:hypothetical protein